MKRDSECPRLQLLLVATMMAMIALWAGNFIEPALSADYKPPSLRAWQRADGGHLTLEWARTVRVQQKRDGDRLILRFAQPLAVDIRPHLQDLSRFIDPTRSGVADTDLTLILRKGILSDVNIREKRIVAIDFTQDPSAPPSTRIETSTIENGVRLTLDWPGPTFAAPKQTSSTVHLTITPARDINPAVLESLKRTLQPWFRDLTVKRDQNRATLSFTLYPQIVSSVRSDSPMSTTIDLLRSAAVRSTPADQPVAEFFIPERKPQRPGVAGQKRISVVPIPASRPVPVTDSQTITDNEVMEEETTTTAAAIEAPDALIFDWAKPVGAAVFLRAGQLFAVFDEPDPALLAEIPAPPSAFGKGSLVPAEGGTAVRYPTKKPVSIGVSQTEEGHWRIEATVSTSAPRAVSLERIDGSAALQALVPSGRRVISIVDPMVGDRIDSLPLRDDGIAQPDRQRFVDLELLPSSQGLAWRPRNDQLVTSLKNQRLEFRSSRGLSLSKLGVDAPTTKTSVIKAVVKKPSAQVSEKPTSQASSDSPRIRPAVRTAKTGSSRTREARKPDSYFDLADSGVERELVNEFRRIRRQAIRKAAPEQRDDARLSLARLLVSERLATEARTVLNTISDEAAEDIRLQKRALTGVSALLIGHLTEATSLLRDPVLNEDSEIKIWRAALDSIEDQWQTAAEHWRVTSNLLDKYPPRLKLDLGLMALRAAIEVDDDKMVRRGMRRLASLPLDAYDQARFDAMKALKAERSGDLERARALLTNLVESTNPKVRTLADFELAALNLKIDARDVGSLASLEHSMPLWRGHPEERDMLDRLARRHVDANALRKALTIWRRLIQFYPKAADSKDLKKARQSAFVQALRNQRQPRIHPVDVYAIYLDFIDLLPGDPEVRDVHRHLAKHLMDLDLLSEAIDVLQSLMTSTGNGRERVELATEIATLMLRQDRPAPALAILDESGGSRGTAIEPALDQEIQLLRAQALARLERADDALLVLRDLQSDQARRLQAKILWDERRWPRLASTIESILANTDLAVPLAEEDQILVLRLALARQRDQSPERLHALRQRFGDAMQNSIHASAFDVATQGDVKTKDIRGFLAATGEQLTELQQLQLTTPTRP